MFVAATVNWHGLSFERLTESPSNKLRRSSWMRLERQSGEFACQLINKDISTGSLVSAQLHLLNHISLKRLGG